jgi:hypothetical protein
MTRSSLMGSGGVRIFLASFCLSGCSAGGAPSFDLFGAFFPAWLLCGVIGIAAAGVARVAFISSGLANAPVSASGLHRDRRDRGPSDLAHRLRALKWRPPGKRAVRLAAD